MFTFLRIIPALSLLLIIEVNLYAQNRDGHGQPNIIFIVADDMGPWTLSINKSPNAFTPALDKLAQEGAILNHCFANAPVCSPSRATLISGRYPSENGVPDLIGQGKPGGLSLNLKTFPELLRSNGYTTILVGKWHLGEYKTEYLPTKRGYDHFTGFPHGGLRSMSPKIVIDGKPEIAAGAYTPDLLTDYAMKHILEANPAITGKPFLLSLHFWAPHANTDFPEGMKPDYKGRSWLPLRDIDKARWDTMNIQLLAPDAPNLDSPLNIRMAKEYYSSVHAVDRNVGRLMDFLEGLSLTENTIVIFTSDHGYMMGQHSLWHKGNGWWLTKDGKDPDGIYGDTRWNLYDYSLNVPCLIKWPGVITPSTRIEETVSFVDWFPTIMEMSATKPASGLTIRGRSIVPLLKGDHTTAWNDECYAEYVNLRSLRTTEWKLVLDFSPKKLNELYYLKKDQKEQYNLYNSPDPEIAMQKQQLIKRLLAHMNDIKDPLAKQPLQGVN